VLETKYKALQEKMEADLVRLREQLEQVRETGSGDGRREGSPYGKKEEEAAETAEIENRLAIEKRLLEQINDIESALNKFGNGTYGVCEKCGQPIAIERLEIIPQASLCVSCKTAK
jgi:DnaK suppressor protein